MPMHTIQVSEAVYRYLSERAARLQLTPEQLIEHLLVPDLLMLIEIDAEVIESVPPANSDEARAAFERLTRCFADVTIPGLEATLADPLITLANVDMDDLPQ